MKLIFWCCLILIIYAYIGYAAILWVLARIRPRPIRRATIVPDVSIIIAAHNEEANLPAKLNEIYSLTYPQSKLQIIVASDGSSDRTPQILQENTPSILPVILEQPNGKACALNAAVREATGDILVFFDVRQSVDPDVISELVSCFADPDIGAVSGELMLQSAPDLPATDALGIYWKIEKAVRKLESASGSVIGVTGAIYAMRRELYTNLPASTILDDVLIPMNVVKCGKRVIFLPSAVARDSLFIQKGREFSRKVRTLTGNYQLIRLAPWLISTANPVLVRFISHKLLRLFVPLLLFLMLLASIMARGTFYHVAAAAQLLFYTLAFLGSVVPSVKRFKPVAIANTFVTLNAAAVLALYNFLSGRERVWVR